MFQEGLAALAEIVAFVALGLTVDIGALGADRWAEGLAVAAFLAFVARPAAAAALLAPVRLRVGERLFVMWGGLKGAVPILLAAFAVTAHVAHAQRIYETVFVVVLASVVVQGGHDRVRRRAVRRADAAGRAYATRRTVRVRPVTRTCSYESTTRTQPASRTVGSQTAQTVWSRRRPRQVRYCSPASRLRRQTWHIAIPPR